MRKTRYALLLTLCGTAACGGDRLTEIAAPKPLPHVTASVNLAFADNTTPLFTSRALAINDLAVVVGAAGVNPTDNLHAVVWRPPTYAFALLPDLGAQGSSSANAIGTDGTIGGEVCGADAACQPAYWRGDALHALGGFGRVNGVCPCDSHTLVGSTVVGSAVHGAIWEDELLIDVGLPAGYANAELVAVAHGYIVGNAYMGAIPNIGTPTPFRWAPSSGWTPLTGSLGGVTDVNALGTAVGTQVLWENGSNTPTPLTTGQLAAVNDSGVVAGSFVMGSNPFSVAGTWTQTTGWTQVGSDMNPTVTDIDNAGAVVGYFHDQGEDFAMLWQP
jgi:hypothetical protein